MADRFDALVSGEFSSPLDYEFWPAAADSSNKLLVVLHGRGDSREGFHWLPEALGIERMNYLFLNAPDAYGPGYSWYELPPRQGPGIVRSRKLLTATFDGLQAELGLSAPDLFLFGFSQGCLQAIDLALRNPKVLGGVVGVSGYVYFVDEYPEAFAPVARHQHLLVTHGFQDEVLPIDATRVAVRALQRLGIAVDWREYEKEHTIDPGAEIEDIKAFLNKMLDLA